MVEPLPSESVEQQVTDKLQSAFLFAFGDDPTPEAVADPMKAQVYQGALQQEMVECLKLLAREIDALRAERA